MPGADGQPGRPGEFGLKGSTGEKGSEGPSGGPGAMGNQVMYQMISMNCLNFFFNICFLYTLSMSDGF